MVIKKVVNKTNKTVKKFSEFDSDKIYVSPDGLVRIQRVNKGFTLSNITHSHDVGSTIRETFEELCKDREVYILNNQSELARFLLGCREFPKVEEIEVGEELAEDEVSVEDCSEEKLYAIHRTRDNGVFKLTRVSDDFSFNSLVKNSQWYAGSHPTIPKTIKEAIRSDRYDVYQFDTQEEFLRWSLEQVTGESQKTIQINEKSLGDYLLNVGKALNNKNTNGFKCFGSLIGGIPCHNSDECGSEVCIKSTIGKFKKEILGLV